MVCYIVGKSGDTKSSDTIPISVSNILVFINHSSNTSVFFYGVSGKVGVDSGGLLILDSGFFQ